MLAADRQATDGSLKYEVSKLRIHGRTVRTFAGCLGQGLAFAAWLEGDRDAHDRPKIDEVVVIEMDLDTGQIGEWLEPGVLNPVEDRIAAWGSGRELALGAMAMGASPERAVEIASEWDVNTGLGVDVERSAVARG